jgi:hypothetical protein
MDDWSKVPSRQAVSEPAPNHQSPMSQREHLPLPDSAGRVKRPPPAPLTRARIRALDPTGLARRHSKEVRGEAPKHRYLPSNPTMTATAQRPNVKNGRTALDFHRPFMDDKPLSISADSYPGTDSLESGLDAQIPSVMRNALEQATNRRR